MNVQEAMCPKCGRPSESGEICRVCQTENIEWFSCARRIILIRCPNCQSLKDKNGWADCSRSREELENDAVLSSLQIFEGLKNTDINVRLEENSKNRTFAHIAVTGDLYGKAVDASCNVEILWQYDSCDRCSRYQGNYWQGIVQLRAEGRRATSEEQERAKQIAFNAEETLQTQGDRLSFITRMEDGREGLDIIVGTQSLGELIAREVTRLIGGRYSCHPTLIGEKEGKKLFRITYAVRLPRYSKGDIILIRGTYGEILGSEGRTISYLDLSTGIPRTVPDSVESQYLGSVRDGKVMSAIFQDGKTLGLMDEETGKTYEVTTPAWRRISTGDKVHILMDNDRIIIV